MVVDSGPHQCPRGIRRRRRDRRQSRRCARRRGRTRPTWINAGLAHGTLPGGGSRTSSAIHVISNGVINLASRQGDAGGRRTMCHDQSEQGTVGEGRLHADRREHAGGREKHSSSSWGSLRGYRCWISAAGTGPPRCRQLSWARTSLASTSPATWSRRARRAKDLGLANLLSGGSGFWT